MRIDPDSSEHPYVQLAAILRGRIERGEIVTRLPSLTALMDESGLSKNTVQRAVRLLKDEGLVHSAQGRGTFVTRE